MHPVIKGFNIKTFDLIKKGVTLIIKAIIHEDSIPISFSLFQFMERIELVWCHTSEFQQSKRPSEQGLLLDGWVFERFIFVDYFLNKHYVIYNG